MIRFIGLLALNYVTTYGAAAATCAVARGLVRAARTALRGERNKAALQAMAAVISPALTAASASTALAAELLDAAGDLSGVLVPAGRTAAPEKQTCRAA